MALHVSCSSHMLHKSMSVRLSSELTNNALMRGHQNMKLYLRLQLSPETKFKVGPGNYTDHGGKNKLHT